MTYEKLKEREREREKENVIGTKPDTCWTHASFYHGGVVEGGVWSLNDTARADVCKTLLFNNIHIC